MPPIVTSWERLAAVQVITEARNQRFGPLADAVKTQMSLYSFDRLKVLNRAQGDVATVAALHAWRAANPVPPWVDPLGEWDADEEAT